MKSKTENQKLIDQLEGVFEFWVNTYFAPYTGRLDKEIVKNDAYQNYMSYNSIPSAAFMSFYRFTKMLKAWSMLMNYQYNPTPLQNIQGRIVRRVEGKTVEVIYIESKPQLK